MSRNRATRPVDRARSDRPGPHPGLLATALLLALAAGAASATAQQPTFEEQVPLAPGRSVEEVDAELRRELDLFPGVEGFTAARLFRTDRGGLVLEISARRDGRLVRERRPWTEADLESFRAELAARFEEAGRSGAVSREGRGGLVLGQTLLGLGFYSWAVPAVLDLDTDRATVAAALLTAGASFYLPYRLTRSASVTETHRNLVLWGGTRGILYGWLAGSAAAGPDDGGADLLYEDDDRLELGAALAGSVGGSFLGYRMAEWTGLDEGTGTLWTTMADIGSLAGLGVAQVAGFFDEETVIASTASRTGEPILETRTAHPRLARLSVLAGAGAGVAAGRWLGARADWTVGDAFGLRSTTALGGQLLLPVVELFVDSDRERWYSAGLLAGGVAGVAAGERLFRSQGFSGGDGLLLNAGHLAGGLTALGLTWLAVGDEAENELVYLTTTALGSGAGFALTYRALADRREAGSGEASSGARPAGDGELQVRLHPVGLVGGLLSGRDPDGRVTTPLLTLRF